MKSYSVFDVNLTMPSRLVYIYVLLNNPCCASAKRIAHDCDISRRTVQRAIADLQEQNLITVEPRYHHDGGQLPHRLTALPITDDHALKPAYRGD